MTPEDTKARMILIKFMSELLFRTREIENR